MQDRQDRSLRQGGQEFIGMPAVANGPISASLSPTTQATTRSGLSSNCSTFVSIKLRSKCAGQVQPRHADAVIRHAVIHIETVRHTDIGTLVDTGRENDITDQAYLFLG